MAALVVVGSGVAAGRVVTAADVPAAEADPQMQPDAALAKALLTAVHALGQLYDIDLVQVGANCHDGVSVSPGVGDSSGRDTWNVVPSWPVS